MDIIELNQFPSVPTTGVATLTTNELRDKTVFAILFVMGGTSFTRAMISDVTITAGQKDILEGISATNLESMNTYNGQTTDASYFIHFIGDPYARTIRGQWLGALDMSVYRDPLTIEVEIAGATAPTLKCYALVGPPKMEMGIGFDQVDAAMVRALVRTVIQPSAAVTRKSYGIGLGSQAGAKVRALHFFHANLTSVEMRKQSIIKHEDLPTAVNSYLQKQFARVPAAGHYVMDRIVDGNQGEAEVTLRPDGVTPWNIQVNLTTSGSDTIYTYADLHTALPFI